MPPPGPFFDPYGSRFGSPKCPENGDVSQSCKKAEKNTAFRLESGVFVECKTNKDVCENPLFARLCGSAPLIFSFFRLGLGGFSAEGGF